MGNSELRRFRHGFGVVLLVVSRALIGEEAWAADPAASFDLPAGEFSRTVQEFMRQAGVSVWYSSPNGSVKGIVTHAVHGVLTRSEALAHMLDGTGCQWTWESENSVLVRVNPDSPASDAEANPTRDPATKNVDRSSQRTEPATVQMHSHDIHEILVTFTHLRDVEASVTPMVRLKRDNRELHRRGFASAGVALEALPMAIESTSRPRQSARLSE